MENFWGGPSEVAEKNDPLACIGITHTEEKRDLILFSASQHKVRIQAIIAEIPIPVAEYDRISTGQDKISISREAN